MTFGISTNLRRRTQGLIGTQEDIACQRWFTNIRKIMSPMLKVKDEDGENRMIKEITVHSKEPKRYAGNSSIEFERALWIGEQRIRANLILYLTQIRWVLDFR